MQHKRKFKGFSLAETMIALTLVGIIGVIGYLLFAQNSTNLEEKNINVIASDVQRIFQTESASSGLLLREIGPSVILDKHLKVSSQATQNIPELCRVIGTENIRVSESNIGRIYAPLEWTTISNRKDYADLCLISSKENHSKIIRIYRGGLSKSVLASSDTATMASTQNSDSVQNALATLDSDIQNTSSSDIDMHSADIIAYNTINILTISSHTSLPIDSNQFNKASLIANCSGQSISTEITNGNSLKLSLPENKTCSISILDIEADDSDAMYTPVEVISVNTASSGPYTLKIADFYRLEVTTSYELPDYTVEGSVNITKNGTAIDSSKENFKVSTPQVVYSAFLPASNDNYEVKVTGVDNSVKTVSQSFKLLNSKKSINAELKLANYVGAMIVNKSQSSGHILESLVGLLSLMLSSSTDATGTHEVHLPHWLNAQEIYHYYVPSLSQFWLTSIIHNAQTQQTSYFVPFKRSEWDVFFYNGMMYGINKTTGDKVRFGRWQTPVKVSVTPNIALVNSDDHFYLDNDGFSSNKVQPTLTPGGLNINEAWLILDRDNDGTWKTNQLDDRDLFGDHGGRVKDGYIDLNNTFYDELKVDEEGNHYINLEGYSFFDEAKLWVSRTFLNDKKRYATYDLKLLKRDRTIVPARDYLKKVYVDSWETVEYDREKNNAILKRSWVQYTNGQLHQSGDQYFFFYNGVAETPMKNEEKNIEKEYLEHLKKQNRIKDYERMKAVFEKKNPKN